MTHTSRDSLVTAVRQGYRPTYLFFWGHRAAGTKVGKQCLSQWWPAPFTLDGAHYASAEHFMMAEKARLFGDEPALQRILTAKNPAAAKKGGREVRGFDEETWSRARYDIVVRGNRAKFEQNAALARFLLSTNDRVLVEASPVDRIWGIGLAEDNANATKPEAWRGLNLLGFALMEVRRSLAARRS